MASKKTINTVEKIASLISNLFNPMFSLLIYFVSYSMVHLPLDEIITSILPVILLAIIPVFGWIFFNVKRGRYTNLDVSDRKQRKSLYFFIATLLILYLVYAYFFLPIIDQRILYLFLLIVAMQLSNYYIKSSMHTALNLFTAGLFYELNSSAGIVWLVVTLVVAYTRIILKRHTWAEVLSGALLGSVVAFLYLYAQGIN